MGMVQQPVSQLFHAEPSVGFVGRNEEALCCHCLHRGVFFRGEVWRERRSEASHRCCVYRVSTKSVCRLGRSSKAEFSALRLEDSREQAPFSYRKNLEVLSCPLALVFFTHSLTFQETL